MSEAKIRLSQKELELVADAGVILTKNGIMEKAKKILLALQEKQEAWLNSEELFSRQQFLKSSPKISKGENYNGLPYFVLDFPRFFELEDIFAIRTMFWWGNFFSITLHVEGNYKKMFEEKIVRAYPLLKEKGFSFCVNDKQWEHGFETKNYLPMAALAKNDFENLCRQKFFLKFANKIPLQEWDEATGKLFNYFRQLIEIVAD